MQKKSNYLPNPKAMLKYRILFLTLLVIISQAFAQKDPIKFGEVDEADVKATKYDKFPDAEAIVLCDYGTVSYDVTNTSDKLVAKRVTRIKILKKAAYEQANHTIYYSVNGSNRERYMSIKGYTYNIEDGKVVKTKLEKSAITEKMINKNVGEIKFTMPNVKEGSVIEYTYELNSDFYWHIPVWYFQQEIPVLWSEYRVSIPQYYEFIQLAQIYKDFETKENRSTSAVLTGSNTTYKIEIYRWVLKDVSPFKDEPFIASVNDHIMKMEFQLSAINYPSQGYKPFMETWTKMVESLQKSDEHGRYLNKSLPDKTIVATLTANKTTTKDKLVAIYDYVKNNIKYNGRNSLYTKKSIKEVWEKKVGNVAEINLLLVNMLREAGIESHPVLSSTRPHGKIFQQYPIRDKFNYVLAYANIDGKEDILLDATDNMLTAGMLSYQALNGLGLLTQGDSKYDWVNLQASKSAKITNIVTATLNMDKTGLVEGEITERFGGYEAIRMRRKLSKDAKVTEEGEEGEVEVPTELSEEDKQKEEAEKAKINKFTWKNLEELGKPLDGTKKVEISEFSQVNDDFIYFTPLLDYRMKENPFKNAERNFDIDYACPVEKSFYMNFVIPEGYKVEELPKPVRLKWQDESIKFDYAVTATGDKVQLISKFVLSRPIFKAEEYKALRDLYAQIVAKQEEQIVLKKK